MKTIRLFIIAAILFAIASINPLFGQKLKPEAVPDDVKQTMEFEYPNVKITFWELNNGVYVANFKEDNSPGKCYIKKNGQWEKTVYPVPKAELPSAITDYVKNNFANYTIGVSQLQEMPNVRIHYYIEAKPEGVGYEASILTFNEVGTLLERKDPANFNKEAKSVVDKTATASVPAKPAANDKNANASAGKTPAKPTPANNKPATTASNSGSKTSNTPANKPSSSTSKPTTNSSSKPSTSSTTSSGSKTTTSSSSKPSTSSNASSGSKTSTSSGSKTSTSSSSKPATSSSTASKTNSDSKSNTASASKPKKEKEEKPVYDERGNKAIDINSVPAPVKTALSKKVQRPEELHWFKIDTFYVANFIAREQKNEVFITKSGVWEKTYTVLPEVSVSGNMLKHLQTYYKGYRFKNAIKETRADKKDVTMVEIYEKNNYKQKLVTTLFFDKTGKLINTVDPNYELGGQAQESNEDESLEKYYEKMNMSNKASGDDNIPKDVMNAFKAKYPHASGVKWTETETGDYSASYFGTRGKEVCIINSYGVITETMTMGNPDNLLSSISAYVKQNHKNCKVVEYYAVKNLVEKKNFYKVIIADKKTKVEQELWFTTSGKIVE